MPRARPAVKVRSFACAQDDGSRGKDEENPPAVPPRIRGGVAVPAHGGGIMMCRGIVRSPAVPMAQRQQSYVYMITNVRCTVLYIGVTSELERRMWQHRKGHFAGFSQRYELK